MENLEFMYFSMTKAQGLKDVAKTLVPDYSEKSQYSLFEVLGDALTEYAKYRKKLNKQENAILVIDDTNKINSESLIQFKDIFKTFSDEPLPLVVMFISSEGKGPSVLSENTSRMDITRIKEPSAQIAFDYFKKHGIPSDFHHELETITGSAFKYMKELDGQ